MSVEKPSRFAAAGSDGDPLLAVDDFTSEQARALLTNPPGTEGVATMLRPGYHRGSFIARDLLVAMGAVFTGIRDGASTVNIWTALLARLRALAITDVLLLGAAHLQNPAIEALVEQLGEWPGTCWIVGDGTLPQRLFDILNDLDVAYVEQAAPMPKRTRQARRSHTRRRR